MSRGLCRAFAATALAMSASSAAVAGPDPYVSYGFRVLLSGSPTAVTGVTRVSPLSRSTEVIDSSNAANPSAESKSPGRTKYDAITLERGLTTDTTFSAWAAQVAPTVGASGGTFRRDVSVQLLDGQQNLVFTYRLRNCWPSGYEALSELNANGGVGQFERLTLQCDSWDRTP